MPPAKKTTEHRSTACSIGADLPNQLPPEGGPKRAATVGSKRKGFGSNFFGVERQKAALKPKFLPGPRGPFPLPSCGGTLGASRFSFKKKSAKNSTQTVKWRFRCAPFRPSDDTHQV